MRIFVFGGSFDPPHQGHLRLLKAGLAAVRPDAALLVPAYRSPLKAAHRSPPAERAALAAELTRSLPAAWRRRARVERFELARGRRTFTYELLRHLRRRRPGAEFFFLVGGDAWAELRRWRRPGELLRCAAWLVGRRPGSPAPKGERLLPETFPRLSSTQVRSRLMAGLGARGLVPPRVLRRIEARGLYGGRLRGELKRSLSPERYAHTLAVARYARELALLHGEDAEAAVLAGLLHDCGRILDIKGLIAYARRRRLEVPRRSVVEREAPLLLHAFVGADLARRRFGVADARVLAAVRDHTLGRPGMGRLERLLFVADIASPDRRFPEAARIRRLARRGLEAAFDEAVRAKFGRARRSGGWTHPRGAALLAWVRRRP